MFGGKKFAEIARLLKNMRHEKEFRIETLERENRSLRTWNEKVRARNAVLRRDRRRLRRLLDANDIPWERENPEE